LVSDALAGQVSAAELQAVLAREAPDVAPDELAALAELLERYLKSLPGAVAALTAMTKEPQAGRSVAFAAGQVLLYVADDDDLLSESEVGAVGLLDDTYFVHGCIAACRAVFPQVGVPAEYEPPDERSVAAVSTLLPAGVTDALDRTCENLVRVASALFAGGGEPAAEAQPARPALRVEAAVEALRTTD
jgi:hypothetical protein